jgi:hypothetical protein
MVAGLAVYTLIRPMDTRITHLCPEGPVICERGHRVMDGADDPLEHTARLRRLKKRHAIPPVRHNRGRTARPGQPAPLSGKALAEWRAWLRGDKGTLCPSGTAVSG